MGMGEGWEGGGGNGEAGMTEARDSGMAPSIVMICFRDTLAGHFDPSAYQPLRIHSLSLSLLPLEPKLPLLPVGLSSRATISPSPLALSHPASLRGLAGSRFTNKLFVLTVRALFASLFCVRRSKAGGLQPVATATRYVRAG
jgi:hypothetical protein